MTGLILKMHVESTSPPGQSYPVAFVSLVNQGTEVVTIRHCWNLFQYLELVISTPDGKRVPTRVRYGLMLTSGRPYDQVTEIAAGGELRREVALLGHTDYAVRRSGKYTALAEYDYLGATLRSESAAFEYHSTETEEQLAKWGA